VAAENRCYNRQCHDGAITGPDIMAMA